MKEYFSRPQDVINALRSLASLGLSVSLPNTTPNGGMFFRVEGCELSVGQILELVDRNALDLEGIRLFKTRRNEDAIAMRGESTQLVADRRFAAS